MYTPSRVGRLTRRRLLQVGAAGFAGASIGLPPRASAAPVTIRYATGGGIGPNEMETIIYLDYLKENVLKNVVSYEDNVKSVLTKVQLGEADAGIVYTTDAATDTAGKIAQIAIPDALNVIAVYPIAPTSDSANPALAKAFVDLVMSSQGQSVLAKYGFISPE